MVIAITALALCITFPILAILSVIGRFLARAKSKATYGLDDWIIAPALILSVGNAAVVLWGAKVSRLGQHIEADPDWRVKSSVEKSAFNKMSYISELLYYTAITLARLSIILFYVRIFPSRKFQLWARLIGSINVLCGLVFLFILMFQCIPINQLWLVAYSARHHCIDAKVNEPFAILSIFLDVAVLCMPWPIVWNLQLTRRRKIAILSIFMLGGVIVAVSIGKAYTFFHVFGNPFAARDYTSVQAPLLFWTVPECCLSVTCACLPTLTPLFRHLSTEPIFQSLRNLFSLTPFTSRSHVSINQHHVTTDGYKRHTMNPWLDPMATARNESTAGFYKTSSSMEERDECAYTYPSEQIQGTAVNMGDLEMGDLGIPTRRGLETRADHL